MTGEVVLVGAGPGEAGLLTLAGRQALESAQVVVYDRLVGEGILALIPPGAEKIDVGKNAGRHPVPQEEINRILAEQAGAGKRVVRLKGGDPFLFGRGGEECETLARAGIPFRVIPGISSALAAPAWAGIPVTHRDWASSVHIITGHRRAGHEGEAIPYKALAAAGGTRVFLMGVAALPEICAGLLAAGMPPDTPAALVEKGTTPYQRRIEATLEELPGRAAALGARSPAVIVVGRVCALGETLCWYDRLPLRGVPVAVTRPEERAEALCARLETLGAQVERLPCIRTVPIAPNPEMDSALEELDCFRWLAFTSPAGVEILWHWLEARGRDARFLAPVRLAAIGPGTAAALARRGLRADLVPEVYDGAHLGAALGAEGGDVLLLRAREGSGELTAALTAAGCAWRDVACYETVCAREPMPGLRARIEGGKLPLVSFTSASTVRGFAALAGEGTDFSRITGVCLGTQTAREAEAYGIPTAVAQAATVDALAEAIKEAAKAWI